MKIGKDPDCESKPGGRNCIKKITRTASKVIVHEDYDASSPQVTNDIALIRLNEAVPLHEDAPASSNPKPGAMPVCLPWPSNLKDDLLDKIKDLENGERVTVTGWGLSSLNVTEKYLQNRWTKTADNLCKEKISQDIDTTKVLCADGDRGERGE